MGQALCLKFVIVWVTRHASCASSTIQIGVMLVFFCYSYDYSLSSSILFLIFRFLLVQCVVLILNTQTTFYNRHKIPLVLLYTRKFIKNLFTTTKYF
jgi:hypothetical protein